MFKKNYCQSIKISCQWTKERLTTCRLLSDCKIFQAPGLATVVHPPGAPQLSSRTAQFRLSDPWKTFEMTCTKDNFPISAFIEPFSQAEFAWVNALSASASAQRVDAGIVALMISLVHCTPAKLPEMLPGADDGELEEGRPVGILTGRQAESDNTAGSRGCCDRGCLAE